LSFWFVLDPALSNRTEKIQKRITSLFLYFEEKMGIPFLPLCTLLAPLSKIGKIGENGLPKRLWGLNPLVDQKFV
jgi:hypothetical protein